MPCVAFLVCVHFSGSHVSNHVEPTSILMFQIMLRLLCAIYGIKFWQGLAILWSSLSREILCTSVRGWPLLSDRMKEYRLRRRWAILGSRRWPWPKQVASNSFLLPEGSVPGMARSDQAGPCHKAECTAAAGESHIWPTTADRRQCPGSPALWARGAKLWGLDVRWCH